MTLINKDTDEANDKFFAMKDISRRACLAVDQNKSFFNSIAHKEQVEVVNEIVAKLFAYVDVVYETARPATKRFPAHTEIKFADVVLFDREKHNKLKRQVVNELQTFNLDLIVKPKTNSYSVKVA